MARMKRRVMTTSASRQHHRRHWRARLAMTLRWMSILLPLMRTLLPRRRKRK
ncbi:hypothetical protein BDY21DRAFT_346897 [Lineolata rhizophorae]|uniref:Uncharacterized protein n=1 Tax=Lineolata rhizophorae TaxID=578093 RepID=A0A6A6NXD1_9PEZI|nr:hypothetical protein BDY21DRAFT_346897 [Lineolata rhizophorae]